MKFSYLITILFLIFSNAHALDFDTFNRLEEKQNGKIMDYSGLTPEKLNELTTFINSATKAKLVAVTDVSEDNAACSHCPKHMKLTGDINKILAEMKTDPKLSANEEVPININRLNFMYYQVKSMQDDGSVRCSRFMDNSLDLKPTKFDGEMQLMAENVFKFEGTTAVQIMDPAKKEIVYYYRGEGDQKNIIVQAVLTKDGGKFRYYYYRPTEKEKNPYGLPSFGEETEPKDATVKKKLKPALDNIASQAGDIRTVEDRINDRNKFKIDVDPTLETRMKVIPKNLNIAKAQLSHNIGGIDGVRLGADSKLSLKGNEAALQIADESGYQYVKVDLMTSLKGETTRTITVPYEVQFGEKSDKDAIKVRGNVVDSSSNQIVTLSLTDSVTTIVRSEFKRDKLTNINSYAIAKDFSIAKDEMASVAFGSNEVEKKYISFQHRKAIKDNITMVLDVRLDENRKASLIYQIKARF